LRNGELMATTLMRSNNAFLLMPYNVFEFTLLQEMIAVSVGVNVGSYSHFALSMHVYAEQKAIAQRAVVAFEEGDGRTCCAMPSMPALPDPFEQVRTLSALEAELRHDYALAEPSEILDRGKPLNDYWRSFYHMLIFHAAVRARCFDLAHYCLDRVPGYFRQLMNRHLPPQMAQLSLFRVRGAG
jgi:hypothetical protein